MYEQRIEPLLKLYNLYSIQGEGGGGVKILKREQEGQKVGMYEALLSVINIDDLSFERLFEILCKRYHE